MPPVQNLKTALFSSMTKHSLSLKECCMPLGYLFVMECSIILILSFVERIFAVPIGYRTKIKQLQLKCGLHYIE